MKKYQEVKIIYEIQCEQYEHAFNAAWDEAHKDAMRRRMEFYEIKICDILHKTTPENRIYRIMATFFKEEQ